MSHVSECIALYRHDMFVTDEQYGQLIEDAHARDLDDEARAEAPEVEPQDADLAIPFKPTRQILYCTACLTYRMFSEGKCETCAAGIGTARLNGPEPRVPPWPPEHDDAVQAVLGHLRSPHTAAKEWAERHPANWPKDGEQPTPEQAAAYLLNQHTAVVSTIETIGLAIEGMTALDDVRAADVAKLTEAVELLGRRMDLRAAECSALNRRIDNVNARCDRIDRGAAL